MNKKLNKMKLKTSKEINKLTNSSITGNNILYQSKNSQKSLKSVNNTNSVVTYQNSNSENTSQKKSKRKIFKSIYTGYSKNTFGSIPYKTENFLINNKLDNSRFNDVKSIFYFDCLGNPGIGKYNLAKDMSVHGWSMKFGGYDTRFKTSFNSLPGVGDYNIEESKILEKKRYDFRYKSLYKDSNSKKNLSIVNQNNINGPSSTSYSPIYQDDLIRLKKSYNFNSFIGRNNYTGIDNPFSSNKQNYPGPGFYFQNTDLFGVSNKNKQLKFSYDEKDKNEQQNTEIKKNPDKVLKKYYNKNDLPNFRLKSRSPKYNDVKIMTTEEVQNQEKLEKQKLKKLNALEELLKNIPEKDKLSTNLKFKIDQEKELEYIKSILGNDNGRPDLFYLSSPRWKENKYKFRTPGPAYYFNSLP
jgi:hypothetical protein